VDRYPLLYRAAAAGTIAFELSFLFLIFFRRLRLVAVAQGLVFHTMTWVFMRIWFDSLVRCYVAFFDWHEIGHRVGRALFKDDLVVLYDGTCRLCRRTMACLRVLDLLGRVRYVNAVDGRAVEEEGFAWLDADALMADMHVVRGRQLWKGFEAYRALLVRMPILWPVLPLLYVWPVPQIGSAIYRRVADARTCSLVPAGGVAAGRPVLVGGGRAVVVGLFLLAGNVALGVGHVDAAWPLACYPTFSGINGRPEREALEMSVVTPTGEKTVEPAVRSTRVLALMDQVLSARTEAERTSRMRALTRLDSQDAPRFPPSGRVRFYRVTLSTVPELWKSNPVERQFLGEISR
jgi:predicted DCC family thiol-disulfide oxidoreductase YuxK